MISFTKDTWTTNDYNELILFLKENQDLKYRDFHNKIINIENKNDLIGVRTPILRQIAKDISKGNYNDFIKINTHNSHEEIMIHGFIIGNIKLPFNEVTKYIDEFIPYISGWASCDSTCSNLKIFKNNLDDGFIYVKQLVNCNNVWKIRFALVILLNYYMSDKYYDEIFNIVDNIVSKEYYVLMAIAWLLSYCYINNPNKTKDYLKRAKIDKFTYNKTINKICDSYRVSKDDKIKLKLTKK